MARCEILLRMQDFANRTRSLAQTRLTRRDHARKPAAIMTRSRQRTSRPVHVRTGRLVRINVRQLDPFGVGGAQHASTAAAGQKTKPREVANESQCAKSASINKTSHSLILFFSSYQYNFPSRSLLSRPFSLVEVSYLFSLYGLLWLVFVISHHVSSSSSLFAVSSFSFFSFSFSHVRSFSSPGEVVCERGQPKLLVR